MNTSPAVGIDRVRATVRPVTALGWSVLAAGAVAWVLASVFGWVEFGYVAAACLLVVVLSIALAVGRAHLQVTVEVSPPRVVVGDTAAGRVAVRNVASRRSLPIALELPIGSGVARFSLPSLAAGAEHEELFVVTTSHRGVIPIGPATTVRGDPIGLLRREVKWTEITELLVHPRHVGIEPFGSGVLTDLEGQVTNQLSMSDLAFNSLREYQEGDDRRYIHWRSSAKVGRFLVRQFLDTKRSHLTVVVDSDFQSYVDADAYEIAISCAASLAVRAVRDEQEISVLAGKYAAVTGTGRRVLDALARAEFGSPGLMALAAQAAAAAPGTSTAVLVTGPNAPHGEMQRASMYFSPDTTCVGLVVAPGESASLSALGAMTVMKLSKLTDLPGLLRSASIS